MAGAGQGEEKAPPKTALRRLRSQARVARPYRDLYWGIINKYVGKGLPGMVMLIKTPEEGTWLGAKGYARLEDRAPMRADTVFHTLVVTKLFTATAIMMLRDEGLLDLDAPIDRYLPADIVDQVANVHSATIRHLLAFVSGIPDHSADAPPWNDPRLELTWYDKLKEIFGRPALASPGEKFHFSNADYKLLAMIIDQLTGSHVAFFQQRIVGPLGLSNTYYKNEPGLPHLPAMADCYYDRFGDGDVENIGEAMRLQVFRKGYGDNGLFSTVTDVARFLDALFGGELVTPASLRDMITVAFVDCHPNVGLGFKVYEQFIDPALYGPALWSGGWGFSAWFDVYYFPRPGVTICWGANLASGNVEDRKIAYFDILQDAVNAVFRGR